MNEDVIEGIISPTPNKNKDVPVHSFPDAIREVIEGHRITRLEWNTNTTYGLLKDGILMIVIENVMHQWIVSDGDMLATDWYVIPDIN